MKLRSIVATALAISVSSQVHAACTAGQFDTSFGPAATMGYVQAGPWVSAIGFEGMTFGTDNQLYAVAPVAVDGGTGLAFAGLARSAKSGALDKSFGGMGLVVPGGQAVPPPRVGPFSEVVTDSAGNVISLTSNSTGYAVTRFHSDGTIDTGFGTAGTTQVNLSNVFWFGGIVALPDGSIVVGGSAANPAASNPMQALFVKLTPAGALDGTFGSGGLSFVAAPGSSGTVQFRMTDIGLLSTGDIVGVGRLVDVPAGSFFEPFAVKVHGNGSLDSTFGTGGFAILTAFAPANDFTFRKMVVQPNDQVVVAGAISPAGNPTAIGHPTVVRFALNGTLDASFGSGGISQFSPAYGAFSIRIAQQANGKFVVTTTGFSDPANTTLYAPIVRLTSVGTLDTAFGGTGSVVIAPAGPIASSAPLQPGPVKVSGQKIFVAVNATSDATPTPARTATFLVSLDTGTGAGCK